MTRPWRAVDGGLQLAVRVTPNAKRAVIGGIAPGENGRRMLIVRIPAKPVDGEANSALIRFLAEAMDLRSKDITILGGQTSRMKLLRMNGDPTELTARIEALVG